MQAQDNTKVLKVKPSVSETKILKVKPSVSEPKILKVKPSILEVVDDIKDNFKKFLDSVI